MLLFLRHFALALVAAGWGTHQLARSRRSEDQRREIRWGALANVPLGAGLDGWGRYGHCSG